jgi:formylglycine-generating enzyme required for sulfatase activity
MKRLSLGLAATLAGLLVVPVGATAKCPPDSTQVGAVCIDKYEASVWQVPAATLAVPSGKALVRKITQGRATRADLTAGGATQLSPSSSCTPEFDSTFPEDGNWTPLAGINPPTPGIYAVSIAGVHPTACITWFQAEQACLLVGKRLLTNREWQGAAASTPDPDTDDGTTDCNVLTAGDVTNTGSRSKCKSNWGVFDMVGNVEEWVGDWVDLNSGGCTDWTTQGQTGISGSDLSCFGGNASAAPLQLPGALVRGGHWANGRFAGVFSVNATFLPSDRDPGHGFRCAR